MSCGISSSDSDIDCYIVVRKLLDCIITVWWEPKLQYCWFHWTCSTLAVACSRQDAPFCGLVVRVPGYRSRGPGFDSPCYQIFSEVVGLERGPLSLSTIEELLGRNSSGSGLENGEYSCGDLLRWPHDMLYPQKLALTSPTSSGHSVGIVRLRTKATEFVCFLFCVCVCVFF
jgi:hypothetical protein